MQQFAFGVNSKDTFSMYQNLFANIVIPIVEHVVYQMENKMKSRNKSCPRLTVLF